MAWPAFGLALVCVCLDFRGRAAAADGWKADLSLGSSFNGGSSQPSGGEWGGSMMPRLGFSRHASVTRWDFDARRRFETTPNTTSLRPSFDAIGLNFLGTGAVQLDLRGRYHRSLDVLLQDPSVTASGGAATSGEASARVSAWRGETGYQARTSAHGGSTQSDGWSQSADAILYPARSSQGAWLARGAYREWTLNDVRALSSVTGTTGYRRAHTPLLTTEGEVGVVAERDADGNTQDPKPAWSFGIDGIARALGLPIESRLRVVHDLITGGEAELRRSVGGMGVSAGWKRSLEAEGGRFDVPVVKDYATVGLEDSLVADAVISVEGSYGRTRPREAGADQIEDYRAQGSVSRPFRPWLWGRATYSYLRQKDAAGSTSHRGRAEIVLTASLR